MKVITSFVFVVPLMVVWLLGCFVDDTATPYSGLPFESFTITFKLPDSEALGYTVKSISYKQIFLNTLEWY